MSKIVPLGELFQTDKYKPINWPEIISDVLMIIFKLKNINKKESVE